MNPLLERRNSWNRVRLTPATLRVALLASCTIDPIVPYLGMELYEAGLPATITVGPFGQIVQQCLDDSGVVRRSEPDVLVVAPRFEDVADPADVEAAFDAAVEAGRLWPVGLIAVLPALPPGPNSDAAATRMSLHARLSGQANVRVADAEAVIRRIGTRNAYHPTLFRMAKIPYTEEVFADLAAAVGKLIRCRYTPPRRTAVIDLDTTLFDDEGSPRSGGDALGDLLRRLRRGGVGIALRASLPESTVWPAVVDALGAGWRDLVDDLAVDDRPASDQLADLAGSLGVAVDQVVTLCGPSAVAGEAAVTDTGTRCVLGDDPDRWESDLDAADPFDVPEITPPWPDGPPPGGSAPCAPDRSPAVDGLAAYVRSLGATVEWRTARPGDDVAGVAELAARAKDFTLGVDLDQAILAARVADGGTPIVVGRVRDRLGDYGDGVVIGFDFRGDRHTVDLFSISCPVLGKGVEAMAVAKLRETTAEQGNGPVTVRYRRTGRNDVAVDTLLAAADDATAPSLHPVEELPGQHDGDC